MVRFFTPRRILVYGAYFWGAISVIIGLFLGQHAWRLQNTIWSIEEYYNSRDHNFSQASWFTKAKHALLAGHEDVSKYNDRFWQKYHEIQEHGQFDRSNLTIDKDIERVMWADQHAQDERWGFVVYRTYYDDDEETWLANCKHLNDSLRVFLELDATLYDNQDRDPDRVRDRAVLDIIDDRELLEHANLTTVRRLWRKRVDDGLVYSGMKMGGWQYGGWLKLKLSGDDMPAPNGMSLNLCLVYDGTSSFMFGLFHTSTPATGPRDPWEPFLLAVDGTYDEESYRYITSWAHGYAGFYGVALSILLTDFHGATYEREMERSAPRMRYGNAAFSQDMPLWQKLLYTVAPAVARPGQYPFDDRAVEMVYPMVREDSRWKKPEGEEKLDVKQEDDAAANLGSRFGHFDPDRPLVHSFCEEGDDPDDCFQMGNFRVRKPGVGTKEVEIPVEASSTDGD